MKTGDPVFIIGGPSAGMVGYCHTPAGKPKNIFHTYVKVLLFPFGSELLYEHIPEEWVRPLVIPADIPNPSAGTQFNRHMDHVSESAVATMNRVTGGMVKEAIIELAEHMGIDPAHYPDGIPMKIGAKYYRVKVLEHGTKWEPCSQVDYDRFMDRFEEGKKGATNWLKRLAHPETPAPQGDQQ